MPKEEKNCWVYINKHFNRGKKASNGSLLDVNINGLIWELNFRGDAPLLIYHTNGNTRILQIDGDLFFPVDDDLADMKNEDDYYDGYLFPETEAVKFLNFILYSDLELEIEEGLEDDNANDYFIDYIGDNEAGFEKVFAKIRKEKRLTAKDLELLINNVK